MKKRVLCILMPSFISAAEGTQPSPLRLSVHSRSAGEIPSLTNVEHVAAVFTSSEKLGHRKRSSSELELQTTNSQASTSCPKSSIGWTSHRIISSSTSKPQAATHRPSLEIEPEAPRKLSPEEEQRIKLQQIEESQQNKEEKWRHLRRHHFPPHRRTGSLPGTEEFPAMYLLMEHSEQCAQVQQIRTKCAIAHEKAARVQEKYVDAAEKSATLLTLLETAPFADFLNQIARLQTEAKQRDELLRSQEARLDDLTTKVSTATTSLNKALILLNSIIEQQTPAEPLSPRGTEKDRKDHRKSSGNFLGIHLPGSSKN